MEYSNDMSTVNLLLHTVSCPSFPICDDQAVKLSLAFTIGVVILGLASFPVGLMFDRFGLLPTRLLAR